LIAAKMSVPPVRAATVHRGRLLAARLDGDPIRLTTVAAPAGWGKTTLLSQWVRASKRVHTFAWISLDEADAEPIRSGAMS
jgi:LuxR family transcriptional regulator, maltose regulon positive regulatory protein